MAEKQVKKPAAKKATAKKVAEPKKAEPKKAEPKKAEPKKAEPVSLVSFKVGQKVKTLDDNLQGEVLSVKVVEGVLKKVKVRWENGLSYVVSPLSIKSL